MFQQELSSTLCPNSSKLRPDIGYKRQRGTTRYHLVLMDYHMPVMDGFTTKRIRELESQSGRARIPIVAFTADVTSDRERLVEAGMEGFVSKPLTVNQLRNALNRFRRKSSSTSGVDMRHCCLCHCGCRGAGFSGGHCAI